MLELWFYWYWNIGLVCLQVLVLGYINKMYFVEGDVGCVVLCVLWVGKLFGQMQCEVLIFGCFGVVCMMVLWLFVLLWLWLIVDV